MSSEHILNPLAIQKGAKAMGIGSKAQTADSGFNVMLDAVSAMGPTGMTAAGMYAQPNSQTVLSAAFSGVNSLNAQSGGYGGMGAAPSFAGGYSAQTTGVPTGASTPTVAGVDGFSQMDMVNTMNQNNLQLLELQAVMQSNMQSWNTKSNILSADHRARMTMIEKFTAR